ncbi:MAG TPA: hypothetical protein VFK76_00080 [Gaiellaceae bacterium]|nr:hypothetical protein [Gaiellaceae bacterium]
MRRLALIGLTSLVLGLGVAVSAAGATNECKGLQVCVPVAGPWVVVPTASTIPRPTVEYQVTCPKGYVAGGLDAELSQRAIDLAFLGRLGAPVNPGISTDRAVTFVGRYVGTAPHGPTFRPHVGCMPANGGGVRVPTASVVFEPGQPTTRRVREVRVRPGTQTVVQTCAKGERLVAASHAFGFFTKQPPSESLVHAVSGRLSVHGRRILVSVKADAELGGIRAVVQVHALCARTA